MLTTRAIKTQQSKWTETVTDRQKESEKERVRGKETGIKLIM